MGSSKGFECIRRCIPVSPLLLTVVGFHCVRECLISEDAQQVQGICEFYQNHTLAHHMTRCLGPCPYVATSQCL